LIQVFILFVGYHRGDLNLYSKIRILLFQGSTAPQFQIPDSDLTPFTPCPLFPLSNLERGNRG
jgi:hypothetical protein